MLADVRSSADGSDVPAARDRARALMKSKAAGRRAWVRLATRHRVPVDFARAPHLLLLRFLSAAAGVRAFRLSGFGPPGLSSFGCDARLPVAPVLVGRVRTARAFSFFLPVYSRHDRDDDGSFRGVLLTLSCVVGTPVTNPKLGEYVSSRRRCWKTL